MAEPPADVASNREGGDTQNNNKATRFSIKEKVVKTELDAEDPAPLDDPFFADVDVDVVAPGGRRRRLRVLPWGCQEIALKVAMKDGKEMHSFEARCKFHKLSVVTDCKRTFGFTPDTRPLALNAAKYWCNQAALYQRQRTHRPCVQSIWDVPLFAESLLVQNQLHTAPRPV